LDYLGLSIAYKQLIRLLETKSFGTPFRNIKRLEQFNLSVQIEHLALTEMSDYLAQGLPVIACVHTADLSYWSQTVDHVVVVVEVDAQHVSVHDPVHRYLSFLELPQDLLDNSCPFHRKPISQALPSFPSIYLQTVAQFLHVVAPALFSKS
jgi:hypothetical protein